ncbi:MAG: C-GCAxxG-C-C family protein [Polyangiaceae bacterium]|nr:C-GCAxxG-C-C family protein [Polyangiaceae bacterium]
MGKEGVRISTIGAARTLISTKACSRALFSILDRAFDPAPRSPVPTPEELASAPLAGGILHHGYQCGMVWGAALAAGAEAHRRIGPGPRAETAAIVTTRRLVEAFAAHAKSVNCSDITHLNLLEPSIGGTTRFLLKGGPIVCARLASTYSRAAYGEIDTSISTESSEVRSGMVSCSGTLVQRRGASAVQTVMAAGFAGGIGLSGGGCGALGAAIWMLGMDLLKEGVTGELWDSILFRARANAVLEQFLECSGHEFECSEIVGRTFESVADHADFLGGGGCARILDVLAGRSGSA